MWVHMKFVSSDTEFVAMLYERTIRSFLDIFILSELSNRPMNGYDIIRYIDNKFNILISSGTVYSLLYSMERKGLIKGAWKERRRVYLLTEKTKQKIELIHKASREIQGLLERLTILHATR